ncbi:MAG: outer membrane protein assembly factor BamC [Burkholderiales bacterium]
MSLRCLKPPKPRPLLCAGLAACAALAGCKSLGIDNIMPNTKVDYKAATQIPTLEIPPDLTRPQGDDRFAVPGKPGQGTATLSEYEQKRGTAQPAATAAAVLPKPDGVRLERAGDQRWLVVNGTPDQVWPVVKEFWLETGFVLRVESPAAGILETDWAENRARINDSVMRSLFGGLTDYIYSTGERDKFRTRLEPGTEKDTTDIYISHRGMLETSVSAVSEQTRWTPRPADRELEAEMLQRLMVRFGALDARAREQVRAANVKGATGSQADAAPSYALLLKGQDGAGILSVNDQFDRAWRRVGLALDRVGFTVEDRDRSKGLYFVRYADTDATTKKENEGWLSKLKFWGGDPKVKSEQYRIRVKETTQASEVSVLTKEGTPDNSETSKRILGLLYDQLK